MEDGGTEVSVQGSYPPLKDKSATKTNSQVNDYYLTWVYRSSRHNLQG
jgi:hypothetical protein